MTRRPRKFFQFHGFFLGFIQLQWGRDPKATEVKICNSSAYRCPSLQWGRDPKATEVYDRLMIEGRIAMLQWGRDPKATEVCWGLGARSVNVRMLQWGRDPKATEVANTVILPEGVDVLQWGRDPKATEVIRPLTRSMWPRCFNGAVTRRPRKYGYNHQVQRSGQASMGP